MVSAWVPVADLPAPLPTLPGGEADWARHIATASEVLWALSGRRWSGAATTRTVEVVAAGSAADSPLGEPSWGIAACVLDGEVYNHSRCPAPPEVRLPGDPVRVRSVTIRGAARDPATYRLAGAYLQDLSGRGWPTCSPGMVVEYDAGRPPPPAGATAAGVLARELGRAQIGDPACGLPANVTSTTRQGITQTLVPASRIVELGQTGLPAVDLWLATVNPGKLRRRAVAWSPDTAPRIYRRPEETP